MGKLTLADVLDVIHLSKWEWSPDGSQLAYLANRDGRTDLWLVGLSGPTTRLTQADHAVTDFCWHPGGRYLTYVQDQDLWQCRLEPAGPRITQLMATNQRESHPAWSPDGEVLAFLRNGALWLFYPSGTLKEIPLPGCVSEEYVSHVFRWSPDGEHVAFSLMDESKRWQTGVVDRQGQCVWRARDAEVVVKPQWADDTTLIFEAIRQYHLIRDYYRLDLISQQTEHLYRDCSTEEGPLLFSSVHPSPDGQKLLYLLETEGWAHLYVQSIQGGPLQPLTSGACEDVGDAGDRPVWMPDSRRVVFSSNRSQSMQRQLWMVDAETGQLEQLTDFPGTNLGAKVAPDGEHLAFIHCDPHQCADIWVMPVSSGSARQLTDSMPAAWAAKEVSMPQEVHFTSAGQWDISGVLFKPVDFDPNQRYPALVWLHGGPIRQMRHGWHHLYPYALFYAYHQYLAHRGYVSLHVNFRGGIGYGREFRHGLNRKIGVDDVADVIQAGRFLKSLDYVDPARVGVWGLSYGGWLTLHALTQYPEEFSVGINIAGIWDMAQAHEWALERRGMYGEQLTHYLGGEPEVSPELHHQASPCHFAENLKAPLYNFHGTADVNVDIGQMDRIVKDCVRLGKGFEAYYYPGEVHTFNERTSWEDAFARIERALETNLAGDGYGSEDM